MFMDRFLNKHYPVLNAISDILTFSYESMPYSFLVDIYSKGNINQTLIDPPTETMNMRALRNAWYHECTLNFPQAEDERMKFLPGK
ncbi:hypothetical protein A2Z22_00805 [Candidatus Woesebacteria bacterium RBG_16_34_12]|uniref:Uncharacterized protein n=1 Tax=Candidatus Woesebacteria bacterium RBG_16_34_12 TaxID=1802480 RepID=A0A1F7X753_9BACT|nr:MAG: hypothetical protein A2Z22_00805 [Candidatus Woesebacteria bacterium RBG_16_34_12]